MRVFPRASSSVAGGSEARTPPLHTRERNRQKLETASQETASEAPRGAREPLYEKFVQPESFSVPKSFSEARHVALVGRSRAGAALAAARVPDDLGLHDLARRVAAPQPLGSALSSHNWRRGEVNVLSPEQQHSPSTVLAFSDSSCSPDKENQPPLGGAKRCSSRVTAGGSVVWEDPGSSSARSPGPPGHHETHET